jgi:membrane-bound metal-dependent hydrolase YbcI (DUF457 family)
MPSPVGHLLGGGIAYLVGTSPGRRSKHVLALALFGSILPDFDFLPGILIGNMRAFHHGISHSLAFAVIFGVLILVFAWRAGYAGPWQLAALATSTYALHVTLDFVSVTAGRGVPLLWPVVDRELGINLALFGYFRYTDIRDGIWSVVRPENVIPLVREFSILGGLVTALLWRERWLKRSSQRKDPV